MSSQRKAPKLAQKHILILGGTSGLGYAVAELSLESHARVTISSSTEKKVTQAVTKLSAAYAPDAEVSGHVCNLSGEDVESAIEELFKKVGTVDHGMYLSYSMGRSGRKGKRVDESLNSHIHSRRRHLNHESLRDHTPEDQSRGTNPFLRTVVGSETRGEISDARPGI
jgi:NAD(P)-dependent dehydrogenase (short-subunit alcohol dehydrogenase family)